MKKELKDYLHLYLGCECVFKCPSIHIDIKGKLRVVTKGGSFQLEGNTGHWAITNDLKPILRKLSDMTEKEMKEVVLIKYNMRNTLQTVNVIGYKIQFSGSGFKPEGEINLLECNAETFQYLLKKGFDIFWLIEAGLAIDKSTLK